MANSRTDLLHRDDAFELGRGELVPVFVLLWVASIARVVGGVLRHETFGTVGTLALLAVVVLPLSMRKTGRTHSVAHRHSAA